MKVETVKEFKRGPYIIKHEWWLIEGTPKSERIFVKSAYSAQDGSFIGDTKDAHRFWKKYGIEKFCRARSGMASIGYNATTKTWFGWSHRAIAGFRKGQKKKRGSLPNLGRQYVIADPKRAAIAFSSEMS